MRPFLVRLMKLTIYAIAAGLVLAAGGAMYYLNSKVNSLSAELALSRSQTALAINQYSELETRVLAIQETTQEFERENRELITQYTETRRELESMRGREQTVVARPGLVESKINDSFQEQQLRLACITGDSTACEKD